MNSTHLENLAAAESIIAKAAKQRGVSWRWASWGAPSTGGPFLWNDIYIIYPDNKKRVVAAIDFINAKN